MALRRHEALALLDKTMSDMSCMTGWTDFLYCARSTYRYDFTERVLIYAQLKNAGAVAPLDFWKRQGLRLRQGAEVISVMDASGKFRLLCDERETYRPYRSWQTSTPQWQLWDRERALRALTCAYRLNEDNLADAADRVCSMSVEQYRGLPVYGHRDLIAQSAGYSIFCRFGVRSLAEDYLTRLRAQGFPQDIGKETLRSIGRVVTDCTDRVLAPVACEMRRHIREGKWWVADQTPYVLRGLRTPAVRQDVERGTPKMWGENTSPLLAGTHYSGTARVLHGDTAYIELDRDISGTSRVVSAAAPEGSALRRAIEQGPHVEFDTGFTPKDISVAEGRSLYQA